MVVHIIGDFQSKHTLLIGCCALKATRYRVIIMSKNVIA